MKLVQRGSKISYIQMFMFLGGTITLVFGLLTAFIPGLHMAWVVRDPWTYRDLEWHIEYLSMQPQIYVATPWSLISCIGGVLGIASVLRNGIRFLRIGFPGIFLGILGLLSPAPFHGGTPETTFHLLLLPAPILTFLGVAIMFSSLVIKFGGRYRFTLLSVPILGIYLMLFPIVGLFNIQLYASLIRYFNFTIYPWDILPFIFGLLLALLGCILCFIKTFTSLFSNVGEVLRGSD